MAMTTDIVSALGNALGIRKKPDSMEEEYIKQLNATTPLTLGGQQQAAYTWLGQNGLANNTTAATVAALQNWQNSNGYTYTSGTMTGTVAIPESVEDLLKQKKAIEARIMELSAKAKEVELSDPLDKAVKEEVRRILGH